MSVIGGLISPLRKFPSAASATVKLKVTVDNDSRDSADVTVVTEIFALDANGDKTGAAVASIAPMTSQIAAGTSTVADGTGTIANPKLWGPPPTQKPNRYVAVTTVRQGSNIVDRYETKFGVRTLKFDPNHGFFHQRRARQIKRRVRSP